MGGATGQGRLGVWGDQGALGPGAGPVHRDRGPRLRAAVQRGGHARSTAPAQPPQPALTPTPCALLPVPSLGSSHCPASLPTAVGPTHGPVWAARLLPGWVGQELVRIARTERRSEGHGPGKCGISLRPDRPSPCRCCRPPAPCVPCPHRLRGPAGHAAVPRYGAPSPAADTQAPPSPGQLGAWPCPHQPPATT